MSLLVVLIVKSRESYKIIPKTASAFQFHLCLINCELTNMDANSSHASVNPPTTTTPTTNTRSDANTTSVSANKDMAWEWGVQKDPLKKQNIWCTLCDKRKKIRKKERQRTIEILRSTSCIDLSENDDEQDDTPQPQVKKRKFVSSRNVRGPIDDVYKPDHGKGNQTTLDKNNPIKEKLKKLAWKKIAVWAYSVGLPFNVVRDEGFQDAINAIGEYGRGMPAPSYHNMRVTLLKDVLEDTRKFVDSFRPQWKKFGCSIMSGFWTDGKHRSLINFLVNCPTGTVFLKSIDASKHIHNVEYIVKKVNEVIAEVGEENVVQFITDNGSNYKAAGKILEEQHPKLFWTPCAAHCVNLIVQDIGKKEETIATALNEARAIVVYIYSHGRILNMMRKLTKNRELHRSCVTRFATQFYTLQSVHENRHHLRVLFVSEQWRKTDFAKKAPGKRVEKIVSKQSFWDGVYLACQIYAPLVDIVRLVDTEERPCMGYIYDAMSRAQDQISKNLNDGNNDKKRLAGRILSIIQTRCNDQLLHPLHAAGCFLNPAIFHGDKSKEYEANKQIMTGLYVAIDRLVPDEDENDTLRQELNLYIDLSGQFGSPAAKRSMTKVAPYIWWRSYGIDTPILRKFAITVLSQTCSASPCERNWSTFDNLHSKKRNCLLQQKLNELVFIQYNIRLQKRFMSLQNKSLDPILLRDVEENDDWTIPMEDELQDFVDGGDDLLWSDVQEAMGATVDAPPNIRSKRESYRDDDGDDINDVGNDLDEEVNALDDVDSEAEPMPCD
ncbi:uncharacterized protein LOC111884863 [Lactuca sativa]|uniref:uncharacterized protein LOC111884863 n=1 Tax=Lactuca sativa TaxID=4236 RepID=UPI0022AEB1AD|nr:uncharacterized protein LOC111884863 [Lactuca sativa]